MDPHSIHLNTEQVLVIHSPQLGEKVVKLFDEVTAPDSSYHVVPADSLNSPQPGTLLWVTEEKGKTVYYDFNPHAGFWRRLSDGFFSLLPIDNQL